MEFWPFYIDNPTLRNSSFGVVYLTNNADFDKYSYFGYGISFDVRGT